MTENKHKGSSLDSFLKEEGMLDELRTEAIEDAMGHRLEDVFDTPRTQALREALVDGENSGVATEFDFDAFMAGKRKPDGA